MSQNILERSAVTTGLLSLLVPLDFPIGDNTSPETDFGWQGEADGAGKHFIPWLTLTPMPASGEGSALSGLGYEAFWLCNYQLYGAGVNRNQSELLMDRARALLCNAGVDSPFTVEGPSARWVIDGVICTTVGSNQRNPEGIPYYYTQTDTYQIRVTEET